MNARSKQNLDRTITIRVNNEEAQKLNHLATEYGTTVSDIIRCTAQGELDKYFGRVRYVDPQQGRAISNSICKLSNSLADARDHLRRIGVNFNQVAKRVNSGDMHALQDRGSLVKQEDLDDIVKRVEKVTNDVGEIIRCIAG